MIRVFYKPLKVIVLPLELLAYVKELSAFVLPEVTLHILPLQGPHLNAQTLQSVIGLQLEFPFHTELGLQRLDRL